VSEKLASNFGLFHILNVYRYGAEVTRAQQRASVAEVHRAAAQRIDAGTPQAKTLAERALFRPTYYAAAAAAGARAGAGGPFFGARPSTVGRCRLNLLNSFDPQPITYSLSNT
jgi:hypothetical protein